MWSSMSARTWGWRRCSLQPDVARGESFSFEPILPIYRLLRRNTAQYPQCTTEMCAIGTRSGPAEITYYPHADAMSGFHADSKRDSELVERVLSNLGVSAENRRDELAGKYEPRKLMCRIKTLSEVIRERGVARIDLLKIDVERSEMEVLNGIERSHWPMIKQVVAEVHDDGDRVEEIDRVLASHGLISTWGQESCMSGTDVRVVYARREER